MHPVDGHSSSTIHPKKPLLSKRMKLYIASFLFVASFFVVGVLAYRFQTEQSLDNSSQASTAVGAPGTEGGLPDFSYAGYLNSTTTLPELPVVVDVTAAAYGAKGNDTVPDDVAFKKAIAAAENGAIYIPAGTYYFNDRILIQKSNVELVGAGQGKTILHFNKGLADVVRHHSDATTANYAGLPSLPAGSQGFKDLGTRLVAKYGKATGEKYLAEMKSLAESATNGNGLIWFGVLASLELPDAQRQAGVADYFNPSDPNKRAKITSTSARNAMTITIDDPRSIRAGDYVIIRQTLANPSFVAGMPERQRCAEGFKNIFQEIHGFASSDPEKMTWRDLFGTMNYNTYLDDTGYFGPAGSKCSAIDMTMRIKSIAANKVTFEQPLPFKIDSGWNPVMVKLTAQSRNGVRNLTVRMPNTPAKDHLTEKGFNGIGFRTTVNSWIKNVTVENADVGISMGVYSADNTVSDVAITSVRQPITTNIGTGAPRTKPYSGHYGITVGYASARNLFNNISIPVSYAHDISVSQMANRNVFSNIRGRQIVFDHHGIKPSENLFTNITIEKVDRSPLQPHTPHVYNSSGGNTSGPKAGAREVFWNVQDASNVRVPAPNEYVQPATIEWWEGMTKKTAPVSPANRTGYVASNFPKSIYKSIASPKNLFDAQLAMRKDSAEVVSADRSFSPLSVGSTTRPFINPTYQCNGFSVHGGDTAGSAQLYSNAVADSSKNITLKATAAFAGTTAGSVEFCWAPYWDDATKAYVNWADGATYFACKKVTTPLKKLAGSNNYEATMTITPNAMIAALPTAAAQNLAKTSVQKKMVVMLRMGNPGNAQQLCSSNPALNTGYGSEFTSGKSLVTSTCGTDPAGNPCYQVIGYKLVAGAVTPPPVVPPPPAPVTPKPVTPQPLPAKPACTSWTDVYINSCNLAASKTFASSNAACSTTARRVTVRVKGTNNPTAMKFYNAPAYSVNCAALKGTEAGWSKEEPYKATKAWDLSTGNGSKKVCVMLKNAGGWGTACGGGMILKPVAVVAPPPAPVVTPTPVPAPGKEELLTKQFYTQLTGSVPAATDATYKANVALVTKNDCKNAVKSIMKSPAFVTRKNTLDNTAYVQMLYRGLLSRTADPAGLTGWTGALTNGYVNRDTIIDSMYSFSEVRGVCETRKLFAS